MFTVWFMTEAGVGCFEANASTPEALALGLRMLEEEDGYVVLSVEEVVPL